MIGKLIVYTYTHITESEKRRETDFMKEIPPVHPVGSPGRSVRASGQYSDRERNVDK